MKKSAFTMIELVFVIVILGILATVAIPRLMVTRDDAVVVKVRSTVSSIQSGIETIKSKNILQGSGSYPSTLDDVNSTSTIGFNAQDQLLFYKENDSLNSILQSPIISQLNQAGHWVKIAQNSYNLYIENNETINFIYNPSTGRFNCDYSIQECKELIK